MGVFLWNTNNIKKKKTSIAFEINTYIFMLGFFPRYN